MDLNGNQNHLSLDAITNFINLPDLLSDDEKLFISNHLAECRQCSETYNRVFDEDLGQSGRKNTISLFRQSVDADDESVLFRSEDSLVEVELTGLGHSDYNLRFLSLPSWLKNEKAALNVDSDCILRILSIDTETMYIIHSDTDIMQLDSFKLMSLKAPSIISARNKLGQKSSKKFYWYVAVALVIFAAAVFIYYTLRIGERIQDLNEPTGVITDLTPGQIPKNDSDTAIAGTTVPDTGETVNPQNLSAQTDYFSENAGLEKYISSHTVNNSRVEIILPSVGSEVKMPVRFEWMTSRKNVTLRFVILTNRDIPVYERLINGQELTIDTKLNPALYYWKLESSDSIEAVGKFIIR
jgi:hypothetical protein